MYKILFIICLIGCKKVGFGIYTSKFNLSGAVIVCDGNSLTAGLFASSSAQSYPGVLDADSDFNGVTFYNKGVSAQETQDMIDDATSDIDSLYTSGANSILIAWEIGNDIYYNGSVNGAMARFWSYCDSRRLKGWKVFVITCPPRDQSTDAGDNSAQYNAKLVEANTRLKLEWAAHANGLIDVAGDARFQGYNLTYYNADKAHYTDAGYAAVAELVKAVIK